MSWFLPEHITHLYYAPVYRELPQRHRMRYNQLFGCYFNEQVIFFELTLAHYLNSVLGQGCVEGALAAEVSSLLDSERRHTEMYRALNRSVEPGLYRDGDFHFIRAPRWVERVARRAMDAPRCFPLFLWLILLQEERSVYYSKEILRQRKRLDPRFVEVNRLHMVDESAHVNVGEALLQALWDRNRAWVRAVNARLFAWVVGEFFGAPKRSGVNVVRELEREFPEIRPRLPEILDQVRALRSDPRFLRNQYSRTIVPKSFARFDRFPEFRGLGRVMPGYLR